MSRIIIAAIVILAMTTQGCTTTKKDGDIVVLDGLSSLADEVHSELKRLNDVSNRPALSPVTQVQGCTSRIVSLDFDGDIMLLVEDLKKSKLCSVRLIGKKPQQDLILSLHHNKVPLWQVLEDASVQLGKMASITLGREVVVFQLNGGVQQ
ncbi:MAG: hypothetical protein B7Z62_08200 [Deltaproteobacteria bacterium 37-65-8]|jgi:hypothetical protein|nr:MAG: hypothetical protein B7Z62_08200 [Deltaproteobacteria bacterium 37-65-8]